MTRLLSLFQPDRLKLFISQDGNDADMAAFLRQHYAGVAELYQRHPRVPEHTGEFKAYHFLSDHYKWALGRVFDTGDVDSLIVVEEDLELAQDFFSYFLALEPVLRSDPTLYCVSAWNDHGTRHGNDPAELRRTSYFPGLGWMLTHELWHEIGANWPAAYWDEFMREDPQRRGRDCIYPAVSRTKTFGAVGASNGQFYHEHLAHTELSTVNVEWSRQSLAPLARPAWEAGLAARLGKAAVVRTLAEAGASRDAVIVYHTQDEFDALAEPLRLQKGFKLGQPRCAYKGILPVTMSKTATLYLVAADAPTELFRKR